MECQNCNKICQTEMTNNNYLSQGIIQSDGTILCIPCNDIKDWADSIGVNKQTKTIKSETNNSIIENKKIKPKKKVIENVLKCPKCYNNFSGPKCPCGFSNPLFR